jgi:hypothetical protein
LLNALASRRATNLARRLNEQLSRRKAAMKDHESPSARQEPKNDELTEADLEQTSGGASAGGLLTTTLSNLANMRHEMLKTVAQNLRA